MLFPDKYIEYLVHFHCDRDYFECHEIMEEYWKDVDPQNKNSIWVGFIQLAVANYHHRRGNFNGALRMIDKSIQIFILHQPQLEKLGMDDNQFLQIIKVLQGKIKDKEAYESPMLPIHANLLLNLCEIRCHELQLSWGNNSDLNNLDLIHRHKLRDRADVIAQRNNAVLKKQKSNKGG